MAALPMPLGCGGKNMRRSSIRRKTWLERKAPLESKTPLERRTQIKRGAKLRVVGHSETADLKREIQAVARDIVIARDGGCIFRRLRGHICSSSQTKDGHLVLQADHLITR